LINGTALTGLSTLCPRRRCSINQVAVVKGWVTPSTTCCPIAVSELHERRLGRTSPLSFEPEWSAETTEYC
jgi:hypothetical protein